MIRVTLIYRASTDGYFDFDYYLNHHVEWSRRLLSDCKLSSIEVEKCVRTLDGGKSDLICITHVDFENESDLSKALEIHGAALMADFHNFTNIQPAIYVCEVLTRGK
jgi:uncharacterized protein (TIGR02118 family)